MIDLDFIAARKKAISQQFENVKNELTGMRRAIEEREQLLHQLRGNYDECEKMTAQLVTSLNPEFVVDLGEVADVTPIEEAQS